MLSLRRQQSYAIHDQREQLAASCLAYGDLPDRPSQISDSFDFSDPADIDFCHDLSNVQQHQLRDLRTDFQDICIRTSKVLLKKA